MKLIRQKNLAAKACPTVLLIGLVLLCGFEISMAVPIVPSGMENLFKGESAEHKRIFHLLKQNLFDQVIEQSQTLLRENPNDPKAMLLISLAQAGRGNDRQALAQADRAGHIRPYFKTEILASLGKYYAAKKRYFRALLCFDAALDIEPSSEIERQVAAIYMARGQTTRASVLYEKLLDKSADYLNLARIYLKQGQYEKAVRFAEHAVSMDNAATGESLLLASCYLLNNQLANAKKTYRMLLSKAPDLLPAYHGLGLIETIQKNYDAAFEIFSAALERAPRLREAFIGRAAVLHAQGQFKQAEADALKAIDSDPSDFLGHLVLGNIMISASNYAPATREYQRAGALFIDFARPHFSVSDYVRPNLPDTSVIFTLANIFYREGLYHFAIEVLDGAEKQSLLINPFLSLSKARALLRLGEAKRSEHMIQSVIERHPQTVSGLVDMGDLAILQKNYRRAAEFYQKAVRMAPEVMRLSLILGDIYNQMQQTDLSIATYKAAISLYPETAILYNQLAWTLAERKNKFGEAGTYARQAIQYAPEDPNIKDTLAWIYYRMGKYNEALNIYSQIKNKSSQNSIMLYRQGLIYQKLKREKAAIEMFEKALDLSDDFSQADQAKKHLKALGAY